MKKQFNLGGAEFLSFQSRPLVADDVNAYELVYTANCDLSNYGVLVTAFRADGSTVQDSGTVSGNTATALLKTNMYEQPGEMRVRFSIISESGSCLTTKEIVFNVVEGNGDDAVKGNDNYPVLVSLIAEVKELQNANNAQKLKAYTDKKVNEATQVLYENISSGLGIPQKTSGPITPLMTTEKPYVMDNGYSIVKIEITSKIENENNDTAIYMYKVIEGEENAEKYELSLGSTAYYKKVVFDVLTNTTEWTNPDNTIETTQLSKEEYYAMLNSNAVELHSSDGLNAFEAVFTYAVTAKSYTDEKVGDLENYVDGTCKVYFSPIYQAVFEYKMPENTGVKSATVVWLDAPDTTDNAYFELLDSSETVIDTLSVYRPDELKQEFDFSSFKYKPVTKIKLYTDMANATVTSITYYNNSVVATANEYTDASIQEAILDSWEVAL